MTGNEIRKRFLDFFAERGHTVVPSDSLVPANDPTLLFTNAGMVQFKNVFLGQEKRPYTRAATAQKCVRAGGKHNDLEKVGRTARHHTFFEMLGNFSFGDYFKKDAIIYAWDFLTQDMKLPVDKLYASIYKDDDEAFQLWKNEIKLTDDRIFRFGDKDNFWAMGDTGPCGPCSEIFFDQGEALGCGKPTCTVGCDCDRYLEVWNLVFMQYQRDSAGKMTPLPSPCIDTGMGLERLAAVIQGKPSNYDSDILMGIIEHVSKITGKKHGENHEGDVSLRVIADHARAATFLINDGVLPSNEGRGYVLRRIMRRALRHGKLLEQKDPFFHHITEDVVAKFQDVYPDLAVNHDFIQKVVTNEEDNFNTTLTVGTQRLDEILDKMRKANSTTIPGDEIFKLYDTFGFPVDLVEETAKDTGYTLDMSGFNNAMQEQREKAMASWKGSGESQVAPVFNEALQKHGATRFLGYAGTHGEGKVVALIKDAQTVASVNEGEEVDILLNQTPFYGESGGQVGDVGRAYNDHAQLDILNTTKPVSDLIVHRAKVVQGTLNTSDALTLEVDAAKRNDTALNHSATHLLHAALKEVLGGHVKQGGSLVAPDRLRFDYTHFSPLTDKERERIEALVNEKVRENIQVDTEEMDIETALEKGAVALFGEKYGDSVRVVSVPGFSKELCGGTHVSATGTIGFFKIIQETGIASGVRRIEAVTGPKAYDRIQREFDNLGGIRSLIKAQPDEELAKLKKLIEKNKELEKQVASLKEKMVTGGGKGAGAGLADEVQKVGDVPLLVKRLEGVDAKTLRTFIDNAKNQLKSVVVVAGAADNGKVLLAAGVTKDLMDRYHAGNILKKVAEVVGGSGGGRPDMAQAGGSKPEKLDEALGLVPSLIQQ
ncbi:MAG: alanine--tRNA ligase [Nitrospinaceae bacterium]|nr:alanine--tRNA ligase [Nitrospinaceae bacterium]NIR56908.1 alanine--tRNA ligase [Nitrospinaceae bacterium]NIS87370.1 alanine--tRNA ligase [Nitrospinaceae bacterium]NIT84225.1 alanine--tRNA ligase [Nitrospinaceae bacterium]NIU46410.1 alanine--tRNA ligase [Nitrospinaceae bacterium]